MSAGTIDREAIWTLRAVEQGEFESRTRRSAELTERARRSMPDGVPMAWMAGLYGHGPLFVAHGDGCHFTDVDGTTYVDFNQADLSATCGFAPPAVLKAIAERARRGLQYLLPVEEAIDVAELLAERYALPGWQFTLSASGAIAEAIRLARHRTDRSTIVVFGGHYHGHLDDMLVEGDERAGRPNLLGVNASAAAGTRVVGFNDLEVLGRVLERGDVAAVITEPALTNVGVVLPADDFHAGVRALTRAHGTLLVLDETHTQTFAHGGLTRAWGLEPDVITLGKSTGGGIPIGAYGMTDDLRDWMGATATPTWERRGSPPAARPTPTRCRSPRPARRYARSRHRRRTSAPPHSARSSQTGSRRPPRHALPWRAHRLGGRSGFCLEPELPRDARDAQRSLDVELIDARRLFMANRGVWDAIAGAGPAASFAHTAEDVDEYLGVLELFLAALAS